MSDITEIAKNRLNDCEQKIAKELHLEKGDWYYGYINGKDFSLFMQDLLIPEDGYVIDTGNYENVNYVCAYRLLENIKKHPLLWKLFFMVA